MYWNLQTEEKGNKWKENETLLHF